MKKDATILYDQLEEKALQPVPGVAPGLVGAMMQQAQQQAPQAQQQQQQQAQQQVQQAQQQQSQGVPRPYQAAGIAGMAGL